MIALAFLASIIATVNESSDTDFNDLGKLMLAGLILAVSVAVAFTFIRLRLRDKKPVDTPQFISISEFRKKK